MVSEQDLCLGNSVDVFPSFVSCIVLLALYPKKARENSKNMICWKKSLLLMLPMFEVIFLHAQAEQPKVLIRPMRQVYVQDQRDRGVLLSDQGEPITPSATNVAPEPAAPDLMEKRDAERRQRTRELLGAGGVKTAEDFHDAAFVFQHGQDADDYLVAHILAVQAVIKGDASSKWIAAATLDRYLQAIGHPQVFGTQYLDRDFLFMMEHKNDPQAVKNHKPETGMTQQPYNFDLIPDALRLTFCVPDLAQQKANLKDFEAGQYPKGILPPGCTR